MAYSCGVGAEEFWRLTPYEISLVIKGRGKEIEQHQWIAAWHVSHVMNMFVKKGSSGVTPARLLGKVKEIKGVEDFNALRFERLKQSLGWDDGIEDTELDDDGILEE